MPQTRRASRGVTINLRADHRKRSLIDRAAESLMLSIAGGRRGADVQRARERRLRAWRGGGGRVAAPPFTDSGGNESVVM